MSVGIYVRGYCVETVDLADSFPEFVPTAEEFDAYEELYALYASRYGDKHTPSYTRWKKENRGGSKDQYEVYIRRAWRDDSGGARYDCLSDDSWEEFWNVFDNKKELLAYVGRNNAAAVRRLMATIERETKRREQGETDDDAL